MLAWKNCQKQVGNIHAENKIDHFFFFLQLCPGPNPGSVSSDFNWGWVQSSEVAALISTKPQVHIPYPGRSWRSVRDMLPQSLVCVKMTEVDIGYFFYSIQKASQFMGVPRSWDRYLITLCLENTACCLIKVALGFFQEELRDFPDRWRVKSLFTFKYTSSLYMAY